ncbi:MAG: hypothetical protein ACP5JH_05005 [Bacteroidota bacterium]
MLSWPVIKHAFGRTLLQPGLLFAAIVEVAVLVFFLFGVHFKLEQGQVVSITIFGRETSQVAMYQNIMLPSLAESLHGGLMFFIIVGVASLFTEDLKDPFLGVVLTRIHSRENFFLSEFAGIVLASLANVLLPSSLISLILSVKLDALVFAPILGALSFTVEVTILLGVCSLFAVLVGSGTGVVLLSIIIYFLLGPLVAAIEKTDSAILTLIPYLIPPMGKFYAITQGLLLGKPVSVTGFVMGVVQGSVYFAIACALFSRRDL